jgi:hypothetical protein
LPVGTLHSSANQFAEVHNPIPLKHAGAPIVKTAILSKNFLEGAAIKFNQMDFCSLFVSLGCT